MTVNTVDPTGSEASTAEELVKKQNQTLVVLKRLLRNKTAVFGGIVLVLFVVVAIFAPVIAPFDYAKMAPEDKFSPPSWNHLFGTDEYGRDIFSRVVYGARFSLTLGIGATTLSCIISLFFGSIAGYFGGRVDYFIMRIVDIFQAIPTILVTIVIQVALGTGLVNTIIAMGIGGMAGPLRLMRASIMSVRTQEYLEAATAVNCNRSRIIVKHVLPNSISPFIVYYTMSVGMVIIAAAGLSFIGLGVQPPVPEWGSMIVGASKYFRYYPYMIIFPGLMISLTVLAANMFGDGLRDAMDPKLKD